MEYNLTAVYLEAKAPVPVATRPIFTTNMVQGTVAGVCSNISLSKWIIFFVFVINLLPTSRRLLVYQRFPSPC